MVLASRHHHRTDLSIGYRLRVAGKVVVMWYVDDSPHLPSTGKARENGQDSFMVS